MDCSRLLIILTALSSCESKRFWTYDLLNMYGNTSDATKLNPQMSVQREGRNKVGFSGFLDWQYDVTEKTTFEAKVLTSQTGAEDDFTPFVLSFPKNPFSEIKNVYTDIIYAMVAECSDFPSMKGLDLIPYPKGNYSFHMCNLDNGNLPEIAPEGVYKVIMEIVGEVDWSLTFVVIVRKQFF